MLLVQNLASARVNQATGSETQKVGRVSLLGCGVAPSRRRRWLLGPKPDVAENVGHPAVEAADPLQGENGAHRHCPAPLLVVAVLHLGVDEDV